MAKTQKKAATRKPRAKKLQTTPTEKPPKQGEQTGKQKAVGVQSLFPAIGSSPIIMPGARTRPGTFKVYRRMQANPTIALARMAAMAPIRAAKWGVESVEGTPEEWKIEIEQAMTPLWSQYVKDALRALDYGFAGFEKVFELRDNLVQYQKVKPLLVDITDIMEDKETGAFAGFKQKGIVIDEDKSVLYTYDGEAGSLYGRSRNENCRAEWSKWDDAAKKSSQYTTKAAGVIPLIMYPEGQSNDATGTAVDNAEHAAKMLGQLGQGNGVYMPMLYMAWAEDALRAGVDVTQLMQWQISFIETKGQHGKEIIELMRHWESLLMRGWLVPERTATEGQHGTKAESEVHAGLSLTISDLDLQDIVDVANKQLVNPLLEFNHGQEAKDSVFIKPEKLGSDEQVFFRQLLKEVFAHPQNLDLFLNVLNVSALLDVAGLPKSDAIDIERAAAEAAEAARVSGGLPASAMSAVEGLYASILDKRIGGMRRAG